ncbi:MAG: YadA-like family protein [Veillonella sp. oral taxon 780]|nr:YadA-like family protein [Veillonella sp. oral taxon 780]
MQEQWNRAISIGNDNDSIQTEATGEKAIAIGSGVKATGSVSIAMGRNAQSLREYTTAIGTNVIASNKASGSTIIGYNSFTKGNQSVNIGSTNETLEEAQYSTAIGYDVRAKAKNAIAIGSSGETSEKVIAAGQDAIAIGTSTQGNAVASTAIGKKAIASSENSIAFGTSAKGVGTSATAIGNGATTAKANAIALGTSAQGTGESSTAIGNGAQATNSHAFAAGTSASATGETSTAVGNSASAAGARAVAVGTNTSATQEEGVAVGLRAKAKGIRSVSVGIDTESTTSDGISVGYLSKSQGLGAIAIGRNAVVSGDKSVAVGYDLTVTDTGSTNIGYTSSVAGNQAVSVGARNTVEAGASAGAALGYFVNLSGKNAIGIGAGVNDTNRVTASGDNSAAIGTLAKATAASAMALGSNANAALAHSVALGEGSTTTEADGAGKTAYLSGESTNNSGNGVISVGNKRNDSDRTATITRRIVSVAGGTDDYDAVNVKQLKALESNEWLLRTQNVGDANPTDVEPQNVNNQTKKRVTLKAGDNIAISNSNGVVTLNVTNVVKSVATDNTNALDISNTNGAVKINPKLATSVDAAGEANKLVTAGTVKTALDLKVNKADELHVKPGNYTVQSSGDVSLIQENANSQTQGDKGFTIKDVAKKSVVDTLQSDYNTFKTKAITFTGDDNQGVARTLDTTLTVKGGANYTSTTTNTNIRVEKDGTTGLAVKLSDKLTGMKEISGTGSQDLVINNGNTKVTVKAPSNGDNGTVDFGNAKVVAPNLDASIKYRANDDAVAKAKSVKLADGFNFVASKDATTTAEGPKSGLAIKAEDNGKVTFGLDKATREKVDNAADKNLSNLSDTGKDKVKELAKTAAQDAVKVANGINTTVEKDTATAGVTTYKVNANDTTVAVTGNGLAITGGELGTDKVRKYSLDLSAATKGKLAAVGNLATNVIGGTTIAADGTVTGPTFSITKADGTAENAGTIKEAIEKLDSANKGQNTKISDTADKVTKLATALGGGAKVENGTFTGPTYNITKADGSGTETASNVGEAITKLDTRITTANGTLVTKGLDFTGNDTTDAGKVHRDLGTTLTIKGAENFTRAANENNIKVVKNGDALDVKLAENLAKMKEISGDGTSDLVIKNGNTKVTVKAPTSGDKGTVDFGDAKVIAKNLDASIAYKAGNGDTKKTVKLQDGFNFTTATDTTTTAEGPKSGLAITTGANGVVTFGLDKATREKVDNAADKNLSNLSDTGKTTVKELAKGAAQDAVKVADGINTTVEKDTATAGVTTYKVNANDTTVAVTGDGLAITGGDLGTDKVRKYSLDLSAATKGKLAAVGNLATNVIGGTTVNADGTVVGPTFSITKADGTNETANTLKDAIDKLNATNAGQNTKISETAGKVTTLEGKVDGIVEKGMVFAGDDAAADKVTRKLGETLNIHGQNNITVKKDGTAADTLNVKLASELKNITSISSGDGTTGSKVTLDANGVSIANTAAGQDGAAGTTKTVTIGKDGINAGGMKITNVAKAEAEGDAANKKYVDDAISNLDTTIRGNATLNFAGNVTKDAQDQVAEKVGLSLATGTLHVNGANNEITTTAKGDTITVGLAQAVKDQLAKVGDTASNGRDGKDGASGAKGLTGKDGLNDKTLTDKVNALRNGEAGSVVYTDENGARLVKAKDGQYYKVTDVDATGNVLNNANPATTVEARVVNPDGTTTGGTTKLSNIADGKVAAGSKDAVNGGQLYNAKSEIGAIIGGTTINENGKITGPTFNITSAEGTAENAGTIKEAIEKLDAANKGQNTKISGNTEKLTKLGETVTTNYNDLSKKITDGATNITNTLTTKGLDFTGNDITDAGKLHRDLGTTLTIKGTENFTRAATENNIKVVKNGDALDVKLAENLAKMKEISGDGTSDLVIKNGDTKVTVKAPTNGEKGTVDFGDAKVIAKNLDTSIAYKSNQDTAKKTVKLQDGFNFTAATDTTTTAEGPKSGLAISAEDNGKVTFGLDKATRSTIDNAADKNLSNLSDDGKNKVKELAKGAAQDAVKVADGINTTVEKDTATAGVTTYKVNANDTTVAVTGDGLAITGGDLGTDKVRKYSLDLSAATKGKLKAVDGLSTVIGGTNITADGTVTGPKFNITKADGTTEEAKTIKDAIDKLNTTNAGQNTKISETAGKVTTLEGKVDGIVEKGMVFAGDNATADKVTRKLGETLNIHGQNNISVKKDATAEDTLNVKLASDLKNITSITNADADGKPGSKITLGADGVSIANTAAGADGAAGETKTVTIGKDGINAGGMKVTNVAKAEADGDAANKKYVDEAISNLGNIVSGNATLNFAGNVTKDAQDQSVAKVGLSLATGTLHVNGAENEIATTAKGDTITVGLAETVKAQLAKVGDTASNGRDGKDGTSGAKGLTGKDGLNDKTLTDKVNALRNGEAGSVVYTNDAGDRVVKAKDGKYYKADEVKADGTVKTAEENKGKAPKVVENPQARVVNGNGETTAPTTLSNIADGKVAADSKEAVNGGQLYTAKSEIGAIIGGTTINENGKITGPTFSITNAAGTKDDATTIKDAIEKLDATNAAQNTKISGNTEKLTQLGEKVTENYNDLSTKITQAGTNVTNALTTKGLDFTGNDTTAKVHRDLGTTLTIKGADNFTRTDAETNNIKVVKNDNDLDVKLAENLGKIKSISNATGAGKPGSTITLGADGVSIANTAAGQDGAAGETKTVTIGKAGINAGGMKVTNVAKAEADGDAANKAYVDNAISNLNTTVTNNANLRYAGDTNEGVAAGEDHLNLPLATGTLKVAGTADQIKTVANNGTITLSLAEKVTDKLAKLGDTSSNGRDGKDGTSGAQGLTGKDGLNDKTLTEKVNALRNGEAGSVVYTNDAGDRVVKAKDGKYYKADEVKADGTVKTAEENNGKAPKVVENPQARVVNGNGETTVPTTLSNIADGKVAANSKEAVNGGQLNTVKSDLATALGGGAKVENGTFTGPTYNITKDDGTGTEPVKNVGDAISKLDGRINNANTTLANKGLDFTGNDTTAKVHRNLGETLTIKGAENFTRTATETNNIKVVKTDNDLDVKLAENLGNIKSISNTTGEGKPGSTITLGADGVSIANTAAGADGAAGETKTVTIGKDGINAGGMKVTNVAKAEADGDAANKKYVDDAITNLNTTVTNNANLRYAGDTNVGAAADADHLNLPLATGTLKVAGTADQIKTVANNGTITLSLDEKVTNKLDKLGDTSSNGRDGKDGTSGATGLTGKDGLNDKTLTDKVNALRNGEAGSVVYTNDAGDRVVKAKDGKYYKADEVKADGTVKTAEENKGKKPEEVTTPQARVVNPNGETTAPTTLSNIADGKVAANSKDAVNGGQLHTVKSDLATALGGDSKVNADGSFTGPTYNITKDDGTGKEAVNNVGDAISKLDGRINNANTVLSNKGLDFYGNKDAADTDKVHRNLGEALKMKGAENFTREANAKNNIDVVKNTAGDGFDVKLAENLGNIKEIAGNGKDNLVIKNGDATITLKPKKEAEGTNPATPATVDFGDTKVVASNLDASIKYRANDEAATNAKSVKLADGFNFVASTDATTTAEGPKSGLAITAEDNGKVTFGLDKATREKVDNAADKNLSNLSDAGKDKVKELAGEAAKAAVTVADGINTTVTTDTTTTTGVTTYKVNANDTTVAVNADSLAIAGGDLDATTKVRAYTLDLSDTVKAKLNAINNVGDTASNGRDGVNGTSGATGLTGKDGLNDKTLTDKVNALRNGEAGSVVYTNDAGDRVVKAKDGKYYKADEVKADGTVKTAEENKGKAPEEVKTPQARVVNPNGETTAPTTLSNIADGKVAADSKEAVNGGQLNTVKTDLATALGGGAKVENGTFTGPTYNITKDDGTGTEAVKNVGDAITKLDGRINNANTALANKGLDFTGNDTTDAGKVHRNLGETLTIKGADNFTRTDAETNNIKVVKNNNDLDVKLAENLGNIKEIAGNGKDNLVIKNGDATITLKPKKDAEGTNPATPATVDFGNAKVVAPNLEASITYRANSAEDANAKTVTLQKGLNFVSGDGTAATAEAAKAGITIAADKDGKVVFGLNEATRNAIDNAADKNLSNLSQDGKDKVADLAKTAARDAVKVTAGNNVTVTSETKDGNTTYTVNGRDTTVKAADNGSVSVTGGTLNAKGEREYTVDLTADAKAELGKISELNTRLGSAEGKITTLQGDMTKAKDDIAANTKAIDANKEAIAANKNAIADNARDIAANRKDIDANKQGIAENKKQIGENAKAIGKNAEDIKKNVEDTKKNTQDIKKNADAIKANTDRIQTVENRVTTAEGKIATNEKAIKDNASAIQSNTKAIGANTTAIAKNANDITKANKEIESLKGNSATKDLSNLTNTGKDTITNLINVTGEHGITVTPSTDTTTRVKTFTAKLNDTVTFGSGDKKITVDGTTGTVTSKAVAADTVKANTVNAKTVQLGDSIGTNTTVTADGIAVTTKNPDGTTSKVEIKNGTVSGLTNTKWDPAKVVTEADRSVVATQGQVKDVTDTLARGRVFVGDTGNTLTVGLGDTLGIKGGATGPLTDGNIGVVSTTAKDGKPATMTVKLAKNVNMKDGSTSYDYYLPERKTNPDGSKEIVKNADGSVKYQLGKDGNPIRLVTTTVNGEGITIAPVKGLDKPTVSLTADGLDNGGNQIHNVAAGTANTDAATVGQVRAAAHALNNRVNEAGAHAAALAAMNPLSYDPLKKSQVMAGVGSYKGNKALALGVAHYANEDTLFNVGVAVGDGSNMVNAGVTYRFGGEDSMIPERYKGGPISSVYVMQDEITALKAENARKDAENAKKEAENEEMKAQIKMLIERVTMLEAKK